MPSVRQFRYWSLGGGDCHCNRYTKPVPGAICETVQVLVSGGGGGDCHCNRYTKPVPGAICETVQVPVSGVGGVIVIVTGIPSQYLVSSVRQFRYWSMGGGGDCHCNSYAKPVPDDICETVQILVSGGGGGDCHCNMYTKLVPGAVCETVQVLVSGGGG